MRVVISADDRNAIKLLLFIFVNIIIENIVNRYIIDQKYFIIYVVIILNNSA